MKLETLAVHAGRRIDSATGAVTPPIHLSTTFERAASGEYPLGFSYSREDNPSRRALEECLAELEGGREALAFASGLAAATAILQGLEPGDHILVAADVYYTMRRVIGQVFAKAGLETEYADTTDLAALRATLRPDTRLIWFESPSNPLMKITDMGALARLGRAAAPNAITICDGTFATPMLQRPLEAGIDMVVHSTTKYLGGHSDAVGGALVTRHPNYLFERARAAQRYGGAVPSPFDCWLIRRGIDTLACRMRMHCVNAREVAGFLERHPEVEAVYYPGLAGHPGHPIAASQMSDFGGMLSFAVKGGEAAAMRVAARCRLFIRATSLGGTHSLIEHRASVEGPGTSTPANLLRVSVGLEHPDDLITDLEQALRR
jgi:cystathionine gamma-synthase